VGIEKSNIGHEAVGKFAVAKYTEYRQWLASPYSRCYPRDKQCRLNMTQHLKIREISGIDFVSHLDMVRDWLHR
jgi:hypothetical protein